MSDGDHRSLTGTNILSTGIPDETWELQTKKADLSSAKLCATLCPWGLPCASPNATRLISATQINLITICKCYNPSLIDLPRLWRSAFIFRRMNQRHDWMLIHTISTPEAPHATYLTNWRELEPFALRSELQQACAELARHFEKDSLDSVKKKKSIMYVNPPGVNRNSVQCIWDNSEDGAVPIEELQDKVNGRVNNNKVVGFNEEC